MGKVATSPFLDILMQVPSPWLTSSTKSVVKQVCAVDSEAKAVARPSVKRTGECILASDCTASPQTRKEKREKKMKEGKSKGVLFGSKGKERRPPGNNPFISRGEPGTNG